MQDAYKLSNGNIADRKLNSLETASLYVMIAIGAQCCGRRPEEVAWAAELFCYARTLAFKKMLENPSVELVRMFLLMAFYMCGACRRNSAFMYLGVATKAASILGLHQPAQYRRLPSETRKARCVEKRSPHRVTLVELILLITLPQDPCRQKPARFRRGLQFDSRTIR